jgi:hypothetical protein
VEPIADWVTISSLATAGGTLVLAVATYSSVRAGQQATRVAERSFLVGMRPVLFPSRRDDPVEKAGFGDGVTLKIEGGTAAVQRGESGELYFGIALRNVGAGLAVLHGWHVQPGVRFGARPEEPDPVDFRRQARDLYVPAGDSGFWQGAIRDRDDPDREPLSGALQRTEGLTVDLLYGDHEGGQRTVSRFSCTPREGTDAWSCNVVRHWSIDGVAPRPTE